MPILIAQIIFMTKSKHSQTQSEAPLLAKSVLLLATKTSLVGGAFVCACVCGRPASGLWSLACLVPRRESYYLLLESWLLHLQFVCVRTKPPAFYDDGRFRSSCMRHPPVAKSSKRRVHLRPSFVHSLAICSSVPSSNLKLPQSSARGTIEQPSWL